MAAAALASLLPLPRLAQEMLLLAALVLTGGLLTAFDQSYQAGALSWRLFAVWAVATLPWLAASRHPAFWLFWVLIAQFGIHAYLGEQSPGNGWKLALIAAAAPPAAALAAVELGRAAWLGAGWTRVLLLADAMSLLVPATAYELYKGDLRHGLSATLCFVAAAGIAGWHFAYRRRDPATTSVVVLAACAVASVFLLGMVAGPGTFLLAGVAILGLFVAGARFVRRLALPDRVPRVGRVVAEGTDAPWYVELVAGVGGWLAAIIGTLLVMVTGGPQLLPWVGGVCVIGALSGVREAESAFARRFFAGLAFCGQAALALGLRGFFGSMEATREISLPLTAVVVCLLAVPLIRRFADPTHEFLTAFSVSMVVALAVSKDVGADGTALLALAGAGIVLLPPRRYDHRVSAVAMLAAAFVFAYASWVPMLVAAGPLAAFVGGFSYFILVIFAGGLFFPWPAIGLPGKAVLLVTAALPAAVLWRWRRRSPNETRAWMAVAGTTGALGLVLPAGLSMGLVLALLGRVVASWPLARFGLAAGALALVDFYYDERMDLLAKSGLLAAAGLCMMAVWLAWRRAMAEA